MSILDHLIMLFFAVLVPWMSWKSYPLIQQELRQRNNTSFREDIYKSAGVQQWVIVLILLGIYSYYDRSWQALGFNAVADTPATWFGFGLLAAYAAFSVYVLQQAPHSPAWHNRVERWIGNAPGIEIGPTNEREMRLFVGVSITAGVCEEIIYRGYLMWYFTSYSNEWVALGITSVLFGLNHFYQGARGVIRTGAVGAALGYLYILTGSLLIPMLLHAMIDYYSGRAILYYNQTRKVELS